MTLPPSKSTPETGQVSIDDYIRTVAEWSQRCAEETRKARRLREVAQAVLDAWDTRDTGWRTMVPSRLHLKVDALRAALAPPNPARPSSPNTAAVRTELEVLRVAGHGHVQVIRGMCTDERPYAEIDRALVRLDDVINPPGPSELASDVPASNYSPGNLAREEQT